MVLLSDERRKIIEPLVSKKASLEVVYDAPLMMNGGHLKGYLVNKEEDFLSILEGFKALTKSLNPNNPLLFAMGDGNQSLATAKSQWEDIKANLNEAEKETNPARYALVELENIFDEALFFEPIHRVFFNLDRKDFDASLEKTAEGFSVKEVKDLEEIKSEINKGSQSFGYIDSTGYFVYTMKNPTAAGVDANHSYQTGDITPKAQIYAKMINADFYAKDAKESAEIAKKVFGN